MIYSGTDHPDSFMREKDFVTMVNDFADRYEKGIKIDSPIGVVKYLYWKNLARFLARFWG